MADGDRLRWWRRLVAPVGDGGDAMVSDGCQRLLEGVLHGGGDRLLSDRPESMELVLDGDAWPALFCGVGGASISSI